MKWWDWDQNLPPVNSRGTLMWILTCGSLELGFKGLLTLTIPNAICLHQNNTKTTTRIYNTVLIQTPL